MKRKSAAILTLGCCSILYGAYYFGVPLVANTTKFENFIEHKIENQTGYKLDLVNPKFKAGKIPSVKFKADELNILNDDGTKALEVINPKIKISLFPLLFKNIEISKSAANSVKANLVYNENRQFLLGQYPIKKNEQQKFNLNKLSLNVAKYNITLDDKIQKKTLTLNGNNLKIKDYTKDKLLSLATDAQLNTGANIAELNTDIELTLPLKKVSEDKVKLDIDIKNLNLNDFTEYARTLSHNKITELIGTINLTSKTDIVNGHKNIIGELNLDKFGIMQKDKVASIYSNYPIKINQDINIINDGIKINNLKVFSEGLDFSVNGNILKTSDDFPTLDLNFAINKVKGANLLPLFPGDEKLNPDFNFYKLKEHMIYGDATGNVNLKGIANYPNLYGNILLTDVYLKEPIKDAPKNGTLKFSFKDHTMNMSAHVLTAPKEYVDMNGTFKLFRNRHSDFTIKTTQNIDMTKALKVLMPLKDIFKFELGPLPMMKIEQGFGNANFRISGTRDNPQSWGTINFRNGTASFITINNMVAHNLGGWVKFNGDDVTFKTTSATLNNLPFEVEGSSTLKGDVTVNVKGEGQNSADLLKIINTSPILKELQDMLAPITSGSGKTKVLLTIFGHVTRGVEPVFNKDLFAKGSIEFFSNKLTFYPEKIPASDVSGIVNFDKYDGNFNLKGKLVNSEINTNGVIKNNVLTANAYSNKFSAGDYWTIMHMFYGNQILPVPGLNSVSTSFSGHYQGVLDVNNFDYSKITAKGKIYNNFGAKSPIVVNNSDFDIKDGHLHISQIRGMLEKNPFNLQIDVDNIMTPRQSVNGSFSMKNFDISTLNNLSLPEYPQLKDFDHFEGKIDVASKIKNNNIRLFSNLGNSSVVYKPKHIKLKVANGHILYDTNSLNLNKINAYVGEMPVFLNGKLSNISSKNPGVNLYITSKPTQNFFDQLFNSRLVYPIKLKGDVLISSKLDGTLDRLTSHTDIKLDGNSSLYYMGASIGDLTNSVNIKIDAFSGKDWIKLNNFKYDKIIASQNGKKNPNTQLVSSGYIKMLPDNNLKFNNFKVKTLYPTDAKIFNIIFKKPIIKQGVFNSDIIVNGTSLNPKIIGNLDLTSLDIPIVDASIKDIQLKFKNDLIDIKTKSSVLDNKIIMTATAQNKFTPPYVLNNFDLHFDNLDTNVIADAMSNYETTLYKQNLGVDQNAQSFAPKQIIIKKGSVIADKIKIKDLIAEDFLLDFSIDNKNIANIKDYSMKLADGTVNGSAKYNINDNSLNLDSHIENINAQTFAESLFQMKSQVSGVLNGDMSLRCTGTSDTECLKTLSGKGNFNVKDGRMPKLGSLEYLLKATNIVTSGITRISINNIIDLITPLKTGQFKSIKGHYNISNGIVKDLEIFSHGKDLNLYLSGSYNIDTNMADMEVYGTLSNNITSVFGKLKNLSLNTLLNTIPFLNNTEYSEDVAAKINKIPKDTNSTVSRIFAADIDGDINGMSYVKSFKWVK